MSIFCMGNGVQIVMLSNEWKPGTSIRVGHYSACNEENLFHLHFHGSDIQRHIDGRSGTS